MKKKSNFRVIGTRNPDIWVVSGAGVAKSMILLQKSKKKVLFSNCFEWAKNGSLGCFFDCGSNGNGFETLFQLLLLQKSHWKWLIVSSPSKNLIYDFPVPSEHYIHNIWTTRTVDFETWVSPFNPQSNISPRDPFLAHSKHFEIFWFL